MIFFLSYHYAFPRKRAMRSRALRIMLTVSLSLVVVIVVMSIMNFLQTSRFDSIREVRSFDYTLDGDAKKEIKSILPESNVFTYGMGEAILSSGSFLVRYIDDDYDGGISLYLGDKSSLLVPLSFYRKNGSGEVTLYMLKSGNRVTTLKDINYRISGIYYTSLGTEFDDTMLFLPLSEADENVVIKTAIKGITQEDAALLKEMGYQLVSWKEAEKSLYGAFLVEKALMYALLSLLFIIIAVSTKSSVVFFSNERVSEMAELEILGMEKRKVRWISTISFLIVLSSGIMISLIVGSLLLSALERFSASSSKILSMTLSIPWGGFFFFAVFMVVITIIFTKMENTRREKRQLNEVIHNE